MKSKRGRRVVASLALVGAVGMSVGLASPAFAGKSGGGGYYEGNKNGTYHKNDTYTCNDHYTLYSEGSFSGASAYDLNRNNYICAKYTNGGYNFVDDVSQ